MTRNNQDNQFDLVVIGAGPGGYVAAARAAQLGMKVACVDREARLGGVCLNVGCIPSKALLDSSEYYAMAQRTFAGHGILFKGLDFNLDTMMKRKDEVVRALTDNVRKLLEGGKVTIICGTAKLLSNNQVGVRLSPDKSGDKSTGTSAKTAKERVLEAKNILLATGSRPIEIKGMEFDGRYIVTSTEALAFDAVPKHLVVVGGGYIGLELGSLWSRLGAKVTIVEMMPTIAGTTDGQISRTLFRVLKNQGLDFKLQTKVLKTEVKKNMIRTTVMGDGDKKEILECDRLLVAVGRQPLTDGLGLDTVGIALDSRGGVAVDESYRTSVKNIYAIGDLIEGPMLAHKASAEGRAAVECMAGMAGAVNYDAMPAVVYTWPEVASVGLTEEQVKERSIPYCKGTYPFSGTGRARCMGETEGLVKILAHAKTDRLLGVHIIGARAADMIAEAVLAMEAGASAEDISRVVHGHPTFAEALQEAAMAIRECSIYSS
ncbi:MAG: dihydrolipoyl dehydrogenase [Desulfobacteraceae bacterium]|nr:MAG: dihydrolipoyl dehydrogenase [Desulfobacteraceae bacterium]